MRRWNSNPQTVRNSQAGVSNRPPRLDVFLPVVKLTWLALLLTGMLAGNGCAPLRGLLDEVAYNDTLDRWSTGVTSNLHARVAWRTHAREHADEPFRMDFGAGFRQGYLNVALGGDGCPPTLPPRRYWTHRNETPKGQQRIESWFAGYPYGVMAAKERNAGAKRRVPTATSIQGHVISQDEPTQPTPAAPSGQPPELLPRPQPLLTPTDPGPDSRPQPAPNVAHPAEPDAGFPSGNP